MKKVISVILAIVTVLSLMVLPTFAANAEAPSIDKAAFKTDYPYIFVHGMGGWAPGSRFYEMSPYWGGGLMPSDTDLIEILNGQGVEAYAPAVGPLSSAWDRACEMYAQLMGTVVDYGEAHSKAHNHDRYGFSYEGNALMGEPWDMEEKINVVGHSFGGATVRLFVSLLAYGNEEEIAATGEDTSPLFLGGHDGCVHSCITLSAPHDGSQVANYLVDTKFPMLLMSAAFNVIGRFIGNDFLVFSLQLGHFGLTPKQGETKAPLSFKKILDFYKAQDSVGDDLTIGGAAKVNELIDLAQNTYYYSYTTATSETDCFGKQRPMKSLNPIFYISSMMIRLTEGKTVDGVKIEGNWAVNDGIVPLASALYPSKDAATARDYEDALYAGEEIETGRWYYTDTMVGMDHLDFCGTEDYPTTFEDFYFGMIEMANSR